jgi:mono/diheme cytochrome c family protein
MRITEMLIDPAGLNTGAQWVELTNAGPEPVNLNGAWIGADNSSRPKQFADLDPVPPGGSVIVRWNGRGTSKGNEFITGSIANLRVSHGSLTLSRHGTVQSPQSMIGFVQWGTADHADETLAHDLGLWPKGQFLPRIPQGRSYALLPGGSPRSPAGWIEAAAPGAGLPNTAPVSAWRGWHLTGAAALAPAAVWDLQTDLLDTVTVSAGGGLMHYRFQAGSWLPGVSLQATTGLPPALAATGAGALDLVFTGPDGGLWHRRFLEARWGPAVSLGRGALLPPALAYNPAARELELVAADPAGQLQFTRTAGGPWSPWTPVGAAAGPVPPALAINLLDRPFDLLFTAPDGTLNGTRFAGGTWGPPLPAGGQTTLRPAVAVTGAGTVEVVITAPDRKVYHNQLADGAWGDWRWTGLESDTAPALLSSPTDYGLELVVSARNGRLLHSRFLNGVWGAAWSLGAVSGQPTAITAGPEGGLELLLAGADGSLWHNRFRPTSPDLVSLSSKVQRIFDVHCVQCHDSGEPLGEQNLEPDAAYFSLVHVPATGLPTMRRVDPGSPDGSYLLHKVSGTHTKVGGTGEQMPQGGRLTDEEIQTIRDWIAQGALNN